MKKSPVYPKYETSDYNSDEYNRQAEFYQFLEEAKHMERKTDSVISSQEHVLNTMQEQEITKNKKKQQQPWKAFGLPWWRGEKKNNKPGKETVTRASAIDGRPRRALSGPIARSLFTPIRKAESDAPYACLDQLGRSCSHKNYGPVYLVT